MVDKNGSSIMVDKNGGSIMVDKKILLVFLVFI